MAQELVLISKSKYEHMRKEFTKSDNNNQFHHKKLEQSSIHNKLNDDTRDIKDTSHQKGGQLLNPKKKKFVKRSNIVFEKAWPTTKDLLETKGRKRTTTKTEQSPKKKMKIELKKTKAIVRKKPTQEKWIVYNV